MNRINIKKFGFAFGITAALLYLGCMVVLTTVSQEGAVNFFNSILHGLDTTNIIRLDIPIGEALLGLIQVFIISWLTGACIAAFYNAQIKKK